MKTKILVLMLTLCVAFSISSCSPKIYGLRGNYETTNSTETDSSYDEVWSRVIDFFATANIPIATLDKESGLIVASKISFDESKVSIENKEGVILNPNAWFVLPFQEYLDGGRAECSFNVRIRKNSNGKTFIGINLGNIIGYKNILTLDSFTLRKTLIKQQVPATCYSTGVFEKELLSLFK